MPFPHTFANLGGDVPASYLDDNFNACAESADLDALQADVDALPSTDIPLKPVAGGAAGSSGELSQSDHQHPPQEATSNAQSGTSYTVLTSDYGKVIELTNAGSITVTVPTGLGAGFNCLFAQTGAGQVTFAAGAGMTQRQRLGYTKTAGQYALVSMYVRPGATEYILSGDMAS